MNDDSRILAESYPYTIDDEVVPETGQASPLVPPSIPDYLQDTYWWAYLHPKSFWFFESEWVVNLILWGNMKKLTNAVLDEMKLKPHSSVLQVACVYGDFSPALARHVGSKGRLQVFDVAPIQVERCRRKLRDFLG